MGGVRHAADEEVDLGELSWRGYDLPIAPLDGVLGLDSPAPERLNTIGVFKADKESDPPFQALAFAGIASPGKIEPKSLEPVEAELGENFVGAARMHGHTYLIPDLDRLLYGRE